MKTLFPMFVKLDGREVLVVGAGRVGEPKIRGLLPTGAKIRVVANEASAVVRRWSTSGQIVLEERGFVSVKPEQITRLVQETGALDRSRKLAREYVDRAKASLEELPDTEYRRALLAVPDFILEREN